MYKFRWGRLNKNKLYLEVDVGDIFKWTYIQNKGKKEIILNTIGKILPMFINFRYADLYEDFIKDIPEENKGWWVRIKRFLRIPVESWEGQDRGVKHPYVEFDDWRRKNIERHKT